MMRAQLCRCLPVRRASTRRIRLLNVRPTKMRGLAIACCFQTALVQLGHCSAAYTQHEVASSQSSRNGDTTHTIDRQMTRTRGDARERLVRTLRRIVRALETFLRGLWVSLVFSTPVVSGSIVYGLHYLPGIPRSAFARLDDWWWRLFLKVVDRSGPTFIKAAQWASTRQDFFPSDVCRRLAQLHTFTRRMPVTSRENALRKAFGDSWQQIMELEGEPLGSGCVASVYKGRMIAGENAGRQVAVKILHPDIKKTIQLDLEIMRAVATVAEWLPFLQLEWLSLSEMVEEFSSLMEMQLDLRIEGMNLERFAKDFEGDSSVFFPRPIAPSTQNVLVEEFVAAEPISNFFPSKKLAAKCVEIFLKMVFTNNFVHGDLHPGNLRYLQRADSGEPVLVFLDAGIVCELEEDRVNFCDLFHAVVMGDGKLAGSLMIDRARHQRCTDPDGFCEGVDNLVRQARSRGLRLGQIQAGELLARMFHLCAKHEVKLESKFARLLIAVAVLEGVGRSLDADCNILEAALPVVAQATRRAVTH